MELHLTRRQREVAELAARGLTNREIAQALFISERTAEGHIQTLFNMLTVNTRTQLATWWVRQQVSAGAAEKGAGARPVALLACDLVPTPSSDELPADEGEAVRHFAELVLKQVVRHGGREVVTSQPPNRRLAVFDVETDAAAAALGVQQAVAIERMRGQDLPHVRAALHSATLTPPHDQLSGPALETCVRLLESAYARQVLVSDAAAPGLAGKTPEGARLLGPTKRLQPGLAEPLTCFQLVDGEDRLWVTRLRPLDRSLTNLPVPLTTFVNRQRELAELYDLHARYRLVTLDGVGGGGKTRLALQFGSRVLDDYADGVWLVELAAIGDGRLVLQALAVALGVREPAGRPLIDAILEHLGRRRLLLILRVRVTSRKVGGPAVGSPGNKSSMTYRFLGVACGDVLRGVGVAGDVPLRAGAQAALQLIRILARLLSEPEPEGVAEVVRVQAHQVAVRALLVAVVPDAHPVEQDLDVGEVEAKAFCLLNEPDNLHRLRGVHAVAGRSPRGSGQQAPPLEVPQGLTVHLCKLRHLSDPHGPTVSSLGEASARRDGSLGRH